MHALAKFAATAKLDWVGLVIALATLAGVKLLGLPVDVVDLLITAIVGAVGRGALLTAKRKAEQKALLDLASEFKAIDVTPLQVFVDDSVAESVVVGPEDDTAPIDVKPEAGR